MSRINAASFALAGTALLVAIGGIAVGAPGDDGTIRACYETDSHVLSVLEDGETCSPKHTPLTWNVQGRQGDPGPAGADATITSPVLQALANIAPKPNAPSAPPRKMTPRERRIATDQGVFHSGSAPVRAERGERLEPLVMVAQVDFGGYLIGPVGRNTARDARGIGWDDLSLLPDFVGYDNSFTAVRFRRPVIGCTVTATPMVGRYDSGTEVTIAGVGWGVPNIDLYPAEQMPYVVTIHTRRASPGGFHVIVACDRLGAVNAGTRVPVAVPFERPTTATAVPVG